MNSKHDQFYQEFKELLKKYGYEDHAYAIPSGTTLYGYGASWSDATKQELIRKLKIMIKDMEAG